MKKIAGILVALLGALATGIVIGANAMGDHNVPIPAKISKADMQGAIFDRPETIRTPHGDTVVLDVTTLKSSDGKYATGMYKAGKSRIEVTEPWGVNEFMYFLEGGVTLTSTDGTVQVIGPGEAVTIPEEWTGVWETDGYTKIWAIYSKDGSGL
jgi:uncharacterized cupin superfamily protein